MVGLVFKFISVCFLGSYLILSFNKHELSANYVGSVLGTGNTKAGKPRAVPGSWV